ncbi:cytochrome c [Sulfuriflexus sp.]|uniref:c-type cytochrome n=1 Tax=Sulfuriflexus sp. TaxID=2015443 RepID=UPI0028CE37D3|nr:cytochrome c [Sulfuriflexus sp.]MDT8403427.1 cytochrome c [Sulfuriflexus sp.]
MTRRIIISLLLGITITTLPVVMIRTAQANESGIDAGKRLYQVYCVQCHGVGGDGYGINVADMEVLPKDHTDTREMQSRTDKDLFKAIKHGGKAIDKSVLMPNWDGNLSDQQIESLVRYLRTVCCEKKTK